MAMLAHVSGIFFPLLGPIAFLLFGSKSRFVRFHAMHSLVGTLLLNLLLIVLATISITFTIVNLYQQYQDGWKDFSIWKILLKSAATWAIVALIGLANTVMNIAQAAAAYRGQLPDRGISARIARRLTGRQEALAS